MIIRRRALLAGFAAWLLSPCLASSNMLIGGTSGGGGGIAFVTADEQPTSGCSGAVCTYGHTVGSGANRLLIVFLTHDGNAGCTDNGTAMTSAQFYAGVSGIRPTDFFFRLGPPTGVNTIVCTLDSGTVQFALTAEYTGVLQSAQPDAHVLTTDLTGSATTITGTITTVASNSWSMVGSMCAACFNNISNAGAGQTGRVYSSGGAYILYGDSNAALTAGAHNQTTNLPFASNVGMIQVSFSPAP
jgi:hypothetical protein